MTPFLSRSSRNLLDDAGLYVLEASRDPWTARMRNHGYFFHSKRRRFVRLKLLLVSNAPIRTADYERGGESRRNSHTMSMDP